MKQVSGKEFARLLQQKGWEHKRTNGNHHIFVKSGHIERISVPIRGNKPLKVGLLRHQMKIAGVNESEL